MTHVAETKDGPLGRSLPSGQDDAKVVTQASQQRCRVFDGRHAHLRYRVRGDGLVRKEFLSQSFDALPRALPRPTMAGRDIERPFVRHKVQRCAQGAQR